MQSTRKASEDECAHELVAPLALLLSSDPVKPSDRFCVEYGSGCSERIAICRNLIAFVESHLTPANWIHPFKLIDLTS